MNTNTVYPTSDSVGSDLPPARPTVHTLNGFVVYETWRGDTKGDYVWQKRPARCGADDIYRQVAVCEHEITFEVPEGFDPRPAQIESLREEQQRVRAAMALRIKQLDDQINSLLALEMS